LSYADAEDGLSQVTDDFIQSAGFQIFHSATSLTLSREEDTVSLLKLFGIIRQ
jgi:hypothetical protein